MPRPSNHSGDSSVPLRPIKTNPRSILPPRPASGSGGLGPPKPAPPPVATPALQPIRRPPVVAPIAPVAPGIGPGAALSAAEMDRIRRRNLGARERSQRPRWIALGAFVLGLLLAFTGGYVWKSSGSTKAAPPTTAPASLDARRQAVALMDDAVRAKHAERYEEAVATVARARQADPAVPGGDILLAEIALRRGDSLVVRRSAREALRRGENVSDANILLALDKWMSRAEPGSNVTEAGEGAKQLLAEATAADFSNGAAWFFLGDIQSTLGATAPAQRALLGGLFRLQPWNSTDILDAKRQAATAEASRTIDSSTTAGSALVGLRRALLDGSDPQAALDALRASLAESQSRILLRDASLPAQTHQEPLARARATTPAPIPHATINPPEPADEPHL